MKNINKSIVAIVFLMAFSIAACAQTSLVGKWHGTDNNLPTVDLTVEQNSGQATGNAVFYLIKRNPGESNPHVDGQMAGPMENLQYEPGKLSFGMHRLDGSVVSFRVELADADHAKLFRTSDDAGEGSGFPLVRVKP
jgi:hypothetical protein